MVGDHGPTLPIASVRRTLQVYGMSLAGRASVQAYAAVLTVAANTRLTSEKAASLFL